MIDLHERHLGCRVNSIKVSAESGSGGNARDAAKADKACTPVKSVSWQDTSTTLGWQGGAVMKPAPKSVAANLEQRMEGLKAWLRWGLFAAWHKVTQDRPPHNHSDRRRHPHSKEAAKIWRQTGLRAAKWNSLERWLHYGCKVDSSVSFGTGRLLFEGASWLQRGFHKDYSMLMLAFVLAAFRMLSREVWPD